jgi:hypothetical protein
VALIFKRVVTKLSRANLVSIVQFTIVGKFQSIMHVIARNKFELTQILITERGLRMRVGIQKHILRRIKN